MRHPGPMFSDSLLAILLMNLGYLLVGVVVAWLVIYSAVRAALTSHRKVMEREGRPGQV